MVDKDDETTDMDEASRKSALEDSDIDEDDDTEEDSDIDDDDEEPESELDE